MTTVLKDDTELFKQFMDNEGFRRWLTDTVFGMASQRLRRPEQWGRSSTLRKLSMTLRHQGRSN